MLETSITSSIVRHAKSCGWWTFKIAGGPFQMAGMPDLMLLKDGRALFIEVKLPGKKPTALQFKRMEEIRTQGGAVAEWVDSLDKARRLLCEHSTKLPMT